MLNGLWLSFFVVAAVSALAQWLVGGNAGIFAAIVESIFAIRYCTRIAPDNAWSQNLLLLVHAHQSVHLIRDTDSGNSIRTDPTPGHDSLS